MVHAVLTHAVPLLAGVFALGFVGYCVHFDKKRRSDPNFRKKLKESRTAKAAIRNAEISRNEDPMLKFIKELLIPIQLDVPMQTLSNEIPVHFQPKYVILKLEESTPSEVLVRKRS